MFFSTKLKHLGCGETYYIWDCFKHEKQCFSVGVVFLSAILSCLPDPNWGSGWTGMAQSFDKTFNLWKYYLKCVLPSCIFGEDFFPKYVSLDNEGSTNILLAS